MTRINRRSGVAAASIGALALALAGCGGSSSGGSTATGTSSTPAAVTTSQPGSASVYTVEATYSAEDLGLRLPRDLAVGPDGNLYVTDASQHVAVISPEGKKLRQWGGKGSGPGQFHFISPDLSDPTSVNGQITVGSDGTVWVSDSGNKRFSAFTSKGTFLRSIVKSDNANGGFLSPFDDVTDSEGNVYVVDDAVGTLTKFSADGTFKWRTGGPESKDADLVGHLHVSVLDRHGRLVVVNDDLQTVVYVDQDGHEVDSFKDTGTSGVGICDATLDSGGNMYATDCANGVVEAFSPAHELIATQEPGSEGGLRAAPRFVSENEAFALTPTGALVKLHISMAG